MADEEKKWTPEEKPEVKPEEKKEEPKEEAPKKEQAQPSTGEKFQSFIKKEQKVLDLKTIAFFGLIAFVLFWVLTLPAHLCTARGADGINQTFTWIVSIFSIILTVAAVVWLMGAVSGPGSASEKVMACVPAILSILAAVTLMGKGDWGGPVALGLIVGAVVLTGAKKPQEKE